jgi:putative ABC transport system ATP-binding protein
MPNSVILNAKLLSHSFDYPLYDKISITIKEGESVAVMGRSGSGKSTLLHTLSGLIRPLKGKVYLFNEDIYGTNSERIEHLRRFKTGVIFQSHYLFKGMNGLENIEIATILANQEIDLSLLRQLKIDRVITQKISELSGGQQQRVSIARVLSKKPKIIFADEPTGNLDRNTSDMVIDVVLNYIRANRGALFMVTHDEEIAKKCDRVYKLEDMKLKPIKLNDKRGDDELF